MTLQMDKDIARGVIAKQLADYEERVATARKLFDAGKPKEAYSAFPYREEVGKNLETYANEFDLK